MALPVRILSTGRYLPDKVVTAAELDAWLGLEPNTVASTYDVESRFRAAGDTASEMGAKAARDALERAGLELDDIDVIICASGTPEQPIPSNAALLHKRLGAPAGLLGFDVGATCMGFIVALDVAASLIVTDRYRTVLVVTADLASCGLNSKEVEASVLFSDAGAAVVLTRSGAGDGAARRPSSVHAARFGTWSEGVSFNEIRGGGSRLPSYEYTPERHDDYVFHMDGPASFKLAAKQIPRLLDATLRDVGMTLADIDLFIPHQASQSALELIRRRLSVGPKRWVNVVRKYGNTISASLPLTLDDCIRTGRVKRGDRLALIGSAAGFSAGVVILDF